MDFADRLKQVWFDSEKRRFFILRTVGNFLVLFSLFGVFITFAPAIISEARYRYSRFAGIEYEIVGTQIVKKIELDNGRPLARLLSAGMPKVERITATSTDFGIVIPKIGANAKIVAEVDAGDKKEYQKALLKGVAHAKGTGYPGGKAGKTRIAQIRTDKAGKLDKPVVNRKVYLFAHSTDNWWNVNRYNAVFFLLKELEVGDEIDIFYKGRRYIYKAVEKKIVEAGEVGYLVEPSEEEVLVLQTCWPPGTTLKRLIVIAKPVAGLGRN